MKKIIFILVALIGFEFSVNAQARITNVTYNSNQIIVKVEKSNGYNGCKVNFAIAPTDGFLIRAVGGDYTKKYGEISSTESVAIIKYSCAEEEGIPNLCQVYNFEFTDCYVSGNNCPEDKKSKQCIIFNGKFKNEKD